MAAIPKMARIWRIAALSASSLQNPKPSSSSIALTSHPFNFSGTQSTPTLSTVATAPTSLRCLLRNTRCFSSSSDVDVSFSSDVDFPRKIEGPPENFNKMKYDFQTDGPRNVLEVDQMSNGHTLLRVTIPGVGDKGLKVWVDNNIVHFTGDADKEYEFDEEVRRYSGSFEFSPDLHRADEVKAEMKSGVLFMQIPGRGNPVRVEGPIQEKKMENPFQWAGKHRQHYGSKKTIYHKDLGILCYYGVTMPGVPETGTKCWGDKRGWAHYSGIGEKEYEGDESGRVYGYILEVMCNHPDVKKKMFQSQMVNGILSVTVFCSFK